ncbi:alpha beta hydrolase fold protein [Colletotrichum kahawae]|uniref:Alpha beta hydrolase fold protein n=1 Tax=Colletotrichum kahawae TaxID=34407 RepID=A0AAD9YRW9_COLKA|nr:alpha beta hydrolase fold protein [Colletotrichum kahawae]
MAGAVLSLNSTNIFFTTQGNATGIPFLLIHGWAGDQTDWAFQTMFLVLLQLFNVITMDLRAHGRSNLSQSCPLVMDPVTMADDAAALLRHLGASASNKAIVMGHSLGGTVVTELVHGHPDLIRGQVIVDPSYYLTPEVTEELVPALEEHFDSAVISFWENEVTYPPDTPDYIKEWHKLRTWVADETAMIAAWVQMSDAQGLIGADYLRPKKVSGIPRLVLSNTEAGKKVEDAAGIDHEFDTVEVIPVGHWIMKVAPERFNQALEKWIWTWI